MNRKTIVVFTLSTLLVCSGCSMLKDDAKDMEKGAEKVADDMKKGAEDVKSNTKDSIDNVISHFDKNKIAYEDMETIETVDFSAKEARMFTHNGHTVYLYHLNDGDNQMKALLKKAKEEGKVSVNQEGTKKELFASVNGNYLMLYDDKEIPDLKNAFQHYQTSNAIDQTQS